VPVDDAGMNHNTTTHPPIVVPPEGGDHYHFHDHLATVVIGSQLSETGVAVVSFRAPKSFGPPLHRHLGEDELLTVVEGRIHVQVGDIDTVIDDGATILLPRGVPHTFQVTSDEARFTTVAIGVDGPSSFDRFVATVGEPLAATDPLPAPKGLDPGRLAEICATFDIEVLGPPMALAR